MNEERNIKRGDIFFADLTHGIGSEQSGYRPVLIIQNDTGNRYSSTVITAIITGNNRKKASQPTHCLIKMQKGTVRDSVVLLEQIRTIDKKRLKQYIGKLDAPVLSQVDKALARSVGLRYCGG